MGQYCTSVQQSQEFTLHALIQVNKTNFISVDQDYSTLEKIKTQMNNQLPEDFTNFKFYQKNSTTWFIGNIELAASNYGILYTPEKYLYYGNLCNGFFEGPGALKIINKGLTYNGQFKMGIPHGKGILKGQKSNFTFQGVWKELPQINSSTPQSGILRLSLHKNIDQIEFQSFQHKKVIIYYKNNSIFTGFVDKKTLLPTGSGKIEFQSGNHYEGQWLNGKFQGTGTYIWKNGQKYAGQYSNGLKHGEGTFLYVNNNSYSGSWKNGQRDGLGKIIGAKGTLIQKGIYKQNKFDLEGTDMYLKSFMQKIPMQQVKSELNQQKQDKQISNQQY